MAHVAEPLERLRDTAWAAAESNSAPVMGERNDSLWTEKMRRKQCSELY
jgi:hypothetical protein